MHQLKWVDGKNLHYGYTTGSCAAAAAKAATMALFSHEIPCEITLMTPKGWELCLPVMHGVISENSVCCGIQKQAGDDPDVTDGILIFATVGKCEKDIMIIGGEGIGTVTKAGLDQPVGNAAINSVPRKMIRDAVSDVCRQYDYVGGLQITISAPDGKQIARETYNEKLGIVDGISILGTSGIVEPMSQQAMLDTMDAEMSVLAAAGHQDLLLVLGNYGERFATDKLKLSLSVSVKCSNYIGSALQMALQHGFQRVLLVGHIGKLCKLSLGIMNSHSSEADGRMESLIACTLRAGGSNDLLKQIDACITTDAALEILQQNQMLDAALSEMKQATMKYLAAKVSRQLQIEVICFTNRDTLPSVLYETDGARDLMSVFHENCSVFVFGGTTEGRELTEFLSKNQISTRVFVASEYGKELLPEESRYLSVSDRRLYTDEMEKEIQEKKPQFVIDATHPYASQVTENIRTACMHTDTPYQRLIRESESHTGNEVADSVFYVSSMEEMIAVCNQHYDRIFSTLGTKELPALTGIRNYQERFIVRVLPSQDAIRSCERIGLSGKQIIAMQGPFSLSMNELMFRESGCGILLTKESGKTGGFMEKITAAKNCGMKAVVLRRPHQENGMNLGEMQEWITEVLMNKKDAQL